ncbi:hypothetical protein NicSoilB11_31500 [Arthrobacter sp. NicSoilB11]|nr:hypothetical protein NicSoilB11_31500 [Arthrobacter sp. NicSoilB11]
MDIGVFLCAWHEVFAAYYRDPPCSAWQCSGLGEDVNTLFRNESSHIYDVKLRIALRKKKV